MSTLRFRTLGELAESLVDSGFAVHAAYGDGDRRPVFSSAPELSIVAVAGWGRLDGVSTSWEA